MLPYMNNKSIMRPSVQTGFGGLNHNLSAVDGEIYDMENMSSREFPLLTPRPVRGLIGSTGGNEYLTNYGIVKSTTMQVISTPSGDSESYYVKILSVGTDLMPLISLTLGETSTITFGEEGSAGRINIRLRSTPEGETPYELQVDVYPHGREWPQFSEVVHENSVEGAAARHLYLMIDGMNRYHWVGSFLSELQENEYRNVLLLDSADPFQPSIPEFYGSVSQNGAGALDAPWWAAGEGFYYDGLYRGEVEDSRKQYAVMGTKVIIFPDKKYYDFKTDEFGDLEASHSESDVTFKGSTYADVDAEANTIYKSGAAWASHGFKAGDAVTISGCEESANNSTFIIREIDGDELRFYENTFTINRWVSKVSGFSLLSAYRSFGIGGKILYFYHNSTIPDGTTLVYEGGSVVWWESDLGDYHGYNVMTGIPQSESAYLLQFTAETEEAGPVTISRSVPDLDFICVNENRLWGCKGDSIYASKLGDPTNFNVFDGLSSDSWAADVPDGGDFTACISYNGYPLFFKENMIYKVQGDKPSNFAWTQSHKFGVLTGCERSLVVVGDTLFYLSPVGICAYTGGFPQIISAPLGVNTKLSAGTAGTDGLRYYISLYNNDDSAWVLYVYDSRYGVWHKEDHLQVNSFYQLDNGLYAVGMDGMIWRLDDPTGSQEDPVSWVVKFADMTRFYETTDSGSQNKKGLLRLQLRCKLASGSSITVYVKYDGGSWHEVGEITSTKKQSYNLPLILRRCDYFQLKLEGSGDAVIYSLTEVRYSGSNLQGGSVNLPTDPD